MRTAFEEKYLSDEAIPIAMRAFLTMKMQEDETVDMYADRFIKQRDKLLRILASRKMDRLTALKIETYERGLRPELFVAQRKGPPCRTFEEAAARAVRNSRALEAARARQQAMAEGSCPAGSDGVDSRSSSPSRPSGSNVGQSAEQSGTNPSAAQPCTNPKCKSWTRCTHTYEQCFRHPDPAVAEHNKLRRSRKRSIDDE